MSKRVEILQLIESGQISVAEGVRRLERLSAGEEEADGGAEAGTPSVGTEEAAERPDLPRRPGCLSVVWRVVFGLGVVVLAWGGWLLARAYGQHGAGGLTWGWVIFLVGLAVMATGWWLGRARWFYLRVREEDGSRFALALPLPLRPALWAVQVAKPFVAELRDMEADQLIIAFRDQLRDGQACVVKVDEDGDQVEMYFG